MNNTIIFDLMSTTIMHRSILIYRVYIVFESVSSRVLCDFFFSSAIRRKTGNMAEIYIYICIIYTGIILL